MEYTGKAWKHHISEHFKGTDIENGAGAGGTIFLDYDRMIEYLKKDGRAWHVAELDLLYTPIRFDFKNDYMATILTDWPSVSGFHPVCF